MTYEGLGPLALFAGVPMFLLGIPLSLWVLSAARRAARLGNGPAAVVVAEAEQEDRPPSA